MNVLTDPGFLRPNAPFASSDGTPVHDAEVLTRGGSLARIVLAGQVYSLRITRAGKLILTK